MLAPMMLVMEFAARFTKSRMLSKLFKIAVEAGETTGFMPASSCCLQYSLEV
jgi:hypothetical protein